ncbi:MAG TPA: CHAP domain-containing protein [Terriglobales bacterium]|nr:CHAP domain-containing protein [Terriglobales bacterium]
MRLLPVALGAIAVLLLLLMAPFAMYVAALTLTPAAVQAQAAPFDAAFSSPVTPPKGGQTPGSSAGPLAVKLPQPPHRPWATIQIPVEALFAKTPPGGFDVGGLPYGQCTWYVAYERGIVAHENGEGWVRNLAARGFITSGRPSVGAILSWRAYAPGYAVYGHVALVVDVDPDGKGFTVAEANVLGEGLADVRWVPLSDPGIVGFVP